MSRRRSLGVMKITCLGIYVQTRKHTTGLPADTVVETSSPKSELLACCLLIRQYRKLYSQPIPIATTEGNITLLVIMEFPFENIPQIIQGIFFNDKTILDSLPNVDDINYKDAQMRTPLHAAASVGDTDFVEFLLANNARVNVKDIKWFTPLHRACSSDAPSVVQILLDNGADRNMRDKSWLTPLHVAAFNGSLECARLLLFYSTKDEEFGTNINASDRGGHTPLHHAVYEGHIDMVRLLLMNGASVNAFDKNDRRAMHWASACNLTGIIDLLCEFGAEVNCRDRLQYTPLHVAAALGNMDVFTQLIDRGADLDARTQRYNSVLHLGCLNGQIEVVKKSLSILSGDCQGNVAESNLILALNQRNLDGYAPIHLAAMSSSDGECLEYLIIFCKRFDEIKGRESSKPILNLELTAGENGWTPLHLAAIHGSERTSSLRTFTSYRGWMFLRDEKLWHFLPCRRKYNDLSFPVSCPLTWQTYMLINMASAYFLCMHILVFGSLQSSMGAVLIDSVNESEMTGHWQIDHHRCKDDLPTGRLLCPVDAYHKNYMERRWLQNPMKSCHPDIRLDDENHKGDIVQERIHRANVA
ncbi:hypothetical protein ACTXT7_015911 [Hymenolepis weldensis]